jgi:outer membrane protein assembly factor BamB
VDLARVQAKDILALLFEGNVGQAAAELQAFRRLHPRAAGHLAGRQGNYADTLQQFLDQARTSPPLPETLDWPTFAGAPSRNRPLPNVPPPRLWAEGPAWRVRLASGELVKDAASAAGGQPTSAPHPSRLAYHPVIAGDKVFVADARRVLGFDLLTGRLAFRYELKEKAPAVKSSSAGTRYTLTAADGRIYARLGAHFLGPGKDGAKANGASALVCLDQPTGAVAGPSARERWRIGAPVVAGGVAMFEGAPAVNDGRVYVALTRLAGSRSQTAIACYDADTGAPRWRQEVCDCPEYEDVPTARPRQHLLTLAGSQVVYCSHAGAIVALDALTGKRAWAVRYPSRGPKTPDGDLSPRDLAPCVYAGYRLFAAPADSDCIFCLDPDTGQVLWERDRLEVVHLLGAAEGRLIFTTPGGIRAISAATGGDQPGWSQPAEGRLPGLGRGVLAGGWVFWPTQDPKLPLRALNQEDGSQERGQEMFDPTQLRGICAGNLVVGGGCLVVAGTEELVGYVPPERFLPQHQRDAARPDAPGRVFYRLARAEAGAGMCVQAVRHFARAEEAAGSGQSLGALARSGRADLLADLRRGGAPGQRAAPATLLSQLSDNGTPVAWGLPALATLGELWERAGRPQQALAVWQAILHEKHLRRQPLTGARGLPQRAADVAAARIRELIRTHGTAVYAPFEKRAKQLVASAPEGERVAVLRRVVEEFPSAQIALPSLLSLARLQEQVGRAGAAAQAYRLWLERSGKDPTKDAEAVPALVGLSRAYERQRCWEAARATWQFLAEHHGQRTAAALGPAPLRNVIAERLQAKEYQAITGAGPPTAPPRDLTLPLLRSWEIPAGRLIVAVRSPLAPRAAADLFFVRGVELSCHEAASGVRRWRHCLPFEPSWLGCHADMVLAGGAEGIQCLRLADGEPVWEFATCSAPGPEAERDPDAALSEFRLTTAHVFCLLGERRVLAFNVESGQVAWGFWAPGARVRPLGQGGGFHRNYHADRHWLVLQTTGGTRLVLASPTGQKIHEAATVTAPWPQAPVPLDGHGLCLVEDAHHVHLLDPRTGKDVWTYKPRAPTALTGEAPRLLGNREGLFAVVPTNYGYELERIDPATGKPLWPAAPRIGTTLSDGKTAAFDQTAVYYVAGNILQARSLADGKRLWHRPLPGPAGPWQVVHLGSAVAAYPIPDLACAWNKWGRLPSWVPLGAGQTALPLARLFATPHNEATAFAVWLHDARDGQLLQRLNFATEYPWAVVALLPHRLIVAGDGRAWCLHPGGE